MSKSLTFSSAVDASKYVAGGDAASPGAALIDIDYTLNRYRFQLQNADSTLSPQVNGVNLAFADDGSPTVAEANAAADIRAAVAATLS